MSEAINNSADSSNLLGAFLHNATDNFVAVRAEDVPNESGSGIDYKLTFFEPQVGKSYKIKFITNPKGQVITHRKVYKNLPDPTRKGKNFHYVSSNNAKTCPVLELFFELNKLKEAGDPLATHKLKSFLGVTNQAVCIVQILSSDDATEIGNIRLMSFSTFGQNATVANLIDEKMNPTEQMIKEGFVKEDIFNIFNSSVMLITAVEADFDGQKGRDFSKSKWAPNKDSVSVKFLAEDGTTEIVHKFSEADIVNGALTPQAVPAFQALIAQLNADAIDVHNMFSYKVVGDERNTESTNKYLEDVWKKVETIVPVIRNATSVSEIKTAGVADGTGKPNPIKDNVPSELAGSVMSGAGIAQNAPVQNTPAPVQNVAEQPVQNAPVQNAQVTTEQPAEVTPPPVTQNPDVLNILNS